MITVAGTPQAAHAAAKGPAMKSDTKTETIDVNAVKIAADNLDGIQRCCGVYAAVRSSPRGTFTVTLSDRLMVDCTTQAEATKLAAALSAAVIPVITPVLVKMRQDLQTATKPK